MYLSLENFGLEPLAEALADHDRGNVGVGPRGFSTTAARPTNRCGSLPRWMNDSGSNCISLKSGLPLAVYRSVVWISGRFQLATAGRGASTTLAAGWSSSRAPTPGASRTT